MALTSHHIVKAFGDEALSHNNQGGAAAVVNFLDPARDLFHRDLNLGDQDSVGTAGHAGVQGDPADVTAHDLSHHGPVVGFAGGAQAVEGVGGDGNSGVEAEGVVGGL